MIEPLEDRPEVPQATDGATAAQPRDAVDTADAAWPGVPEEPRRWTIAEDAPEDFLGPLLIVGCW